MTSLQWHEVDPELLLLIHTDLHKFLQLVRIQEIRRFKSL